MNELLVFIQSLPEALKTGFIYSIMVMGVYITYKILDFPDMCSIFFIKKWIFWNYKSVYRTYFSSYWWNDSRLFNRSVTCLFKN